MSRVAHEQPVHFLNQIADSMVEIDRESMEEHVETMHIPPRRRDPLKAIPFAGVRLDDVQVARAVELLRTMQDASVEVVARHMEVPPEALELALAEFRPRWRAFLYERSA